MLLELIATFVAGAGAAGIVMLVKRLVRGRLPRWSVPVAAGLAMISYAIWSEYTWALRTTNGLPAGLVVVQAVEESFVWKPWTYVRPQIRRLVAADPATMRTNPNTPHLRLVDLYFFARWKRLVKVPQLVDCQTASRADVTEAALQDPTRAAWIPIAEESDLHEVVCSG